MPKPSSQSYLSGLKALSVVLMVFLWMLGLVILLTTTQASSVITPALLMHASSALILLLLVLIFKGHCNEDLAWRSVRLSYVILALFLGFAFWQLQQFITVLLTPHDWEKQALSWQKSQVGFVMWSVFLASCVFGPMFEELMFRGLIYQQVLNKSNYLIAALVSSGLFTMLHWNINDAVWLFLAGMMYATLREKSGSIWPAILAHFIQNLMTFLLYVSV